MCGFLFLLSNFPLQSLEYATYSSLWLISTAEELSYRVVFCCKRDSENREFYDLPGTFLHHGKNPTCKNVSNRNHKLSLKPHLPALKYRYGTPNFWHHADNFKARHSQFLTCKCIGPKCNLAPVLKILGVPRLPPEGSLGKRGTVPKIWHAVLIF